MKVAHKIARETEFRSHFRERVCGPFTCYRPTRTFVLTDLQSPAHTKENLIR